MTVIRKGLEVFEIDKNIIINQIEKIIKQNKQYRKIREYDNKIIVNVKPNIFLLGTEMEIEIEQTGKKFAVKVKTTSQKLIMGDIFGYYDRYIREFLDALKYSIAKSENIE